MRSILVAVSILGVASATGADAPGKNVITVVVADGPFAGSYTANNVACVHIKDRNTFGCGWKAFSDHPTTKTLEEAGIQVDRVSVPGAKTGDVIVKFAAAGSDKLQDYSISNVPLTYTSNGNGGQISFEGKTKDGIHLRVSGTGVEVEEF
jgi:hypothetical protein